MQEHRPFYDVLHIGRSKCASTYLQRTALPSHPEIDLFFAEHKAIFHQYWDYNFAVEPADFLQQLGRQPHWERKPGARVRVFSHETLTGNMATGRGARLIADLTVRAFGNNIRAFIIVREPYAYISSVWNQYVQEGGPLSLKDYLGASYSPTWNRDLGCSRLWQTAMNSHLVEYWQQLLGSEQLLVLCMEDLKQDSAAFWKRLYGFLGVDDSFVPPKAVERQGYSLPMLKIKRLLNRWVRNPHNPGGLLPLAVHEQIRGAGRKYGQLIKSRQKLDPKALAPAEIREAIRDDNRRLGELLGRDLSLLGYDC